MHLGSYVSKNTCICRAQKYEKEVLKWLPIFSRGGGGKCFWPHDTIMILHGLVFSLSRSSDVTRNLQTHQFKHWDCILEWLRVDFFQGLVPQPFLVLYLAWQLHLLQEISIGLILDESPCWSSHSPLLYSWGLCSFLHSFTALLKLELPCGSWFSCTAQVAKLINSESSTSGLPSGLGHLNHGALQGCLGLPSANHHFTDHFCVFQNGK